MTNAPDGPNGSDVSNVSNVSNEPSVPSGPSVPSVPEPSDEGDDFGALLDASLQAQRRRYSVGEKVRATVVQVGHERLLLDLGAGQDAMMELKEFGEPENWAEIKEGDVVDGFILRFDNRVAELGLKAGRGSGHGIAQLEDAHRNGLPVQGVVSEVNKGGYVVDVAGLRAFCPLGAMDVRRIEDPTVMIGQRLMFRVTEVRGERDVVLSRRALLQEENERKRAETREKLHVGARLRGTVVNVREFGAFVDLGGVEGLVPVSEIGFGRVSAEDVMRVGQAVDVEVLRMEPGPDGRERISLSMKRLLDDPFAPAIAGLEPGAVVRGTVTRVQPFGAFVELAPGVEGLVHVSAFGKRIGHPSDVVKPGQVVAVRVEGVDAEARRISLRYADPGDQAEMQAAGDDLPVSPTGLRILRVAQPVAADSIEEQEREHDRAPDRARAARAPSPLSKVGDIVAATVDRVEQYGVFVSWATGRGLVPARELGVPRGADLRRQFGAGTTLDVAVIDIRDDGKVTLSKIAVEKAAERAETDAYRRQASAGPAPSAGLGSLADVFGKMKKGR